jgi:diguanylate cyclase (GGDEF)-like protein/PAS domain S-box-containing protein
VLPYVAAKICCGVPALGFYNRSNSGQNRQRSVHMSKMPKLSNVPAIKKIAESILDESDRLASLYSYGLLDSSAEEDFDEIVALAAEICGTSMALVSLVDAERQWFKARVGLDVTETPRSISFCHYAVLSEDDTMEVSDASIDERFMANPLVTGEPHIRLYTGTVLRDHQGRGIGTLCVLDRKEGRLTSTQLHNLELLGRQVMALIELRRESAALAHAEAALDATAQAGSRHAIITLDSELRILGWSRDAERIYGYPAAAVRGRGFTAVLQTDLPLAARNEIVATLSEQGSWEGDLIHHHLDGSPVRVHSRLEAQRSSDGERVGYIVRNDDLTSPDIERLCHRTYADIVTQMANGKTLATLSSELCRVVERAFPGARAMLMAVDEETETLRIIAAPSLSTHFAATFAEVPIGPEVGSFGSAAHYGTVVISKDISKDSKWQDWEETLRAEGLLSCWSKAIIGPARYVLGTFSVYWDRIHEPGDDERQLVATLTSLASIVVTARKSELARDERDLLTDLLNRSGLDRALARLSSDLEVCVIVLGVDRFGLVNRQYGLDIGDRVLVRIAQRIRRASGGCTIGRLTSDEFVLVTDAASGPALAKNLVVALREPLEVEGHELWLTASIGVARGAVDQGQVVLRAAAAASASARRLGGNQSLDIDLPTQDLSTTSLELVGALHRAVATGELVVHYQPKVTIATGMIEGFEALVRWTRADGTSVAPSVFIPLAEEIGLVDTIGEQVLRKACIDATGWDVGLGGTVPGIAVNVSGRQLVAGRLAPIVARALSSSGFPAERLTLEVTETALAEDLEAAVGALREVKALGVKISIDDFGTGYSSLGYLSRFPIDELKIDKSFVERMCDDEAVGAIVRSVINLSHSLGLRCTAEGVERLEQFEMLTTLDCDAFQGYLVSPAISNQLVLSFVSEFSMPTSADSS